jgi:hypothetical protein
LNFFNTIPLGKQGAFRYKNIAIEELTIYEWLITKNTTVGASVLWNNNKAELTCHVKGSTSAQFLVAFQVTNPYNLLSIAYRPYNI